MTTTIGKKGLLNADLVIVQNATFACTFLHKDENGEAIDHAGWSIAGEGIYQRSGGAWASASSVALDSTVGH